MKVVLHEKTYDLIKTAIKEHGRHLNYITLNWEEVNDLMNTNSIIAELKSRNPQSWIRGSRSVVLNKREILKWLGHYFGISFEYHDSMRPELSAELY
jgi:hypothetical protein